MGLALETVSHWKSVLLKDQSFPTDRATEGKEAWFAGLTAPTWCSSMSTLSPPPSSPYHPRKHTLDHHCKDTVPNPQGRRLHFTNIQQSRPPQSHNVYKTTLGVGTLETCPSRTSELCLLQESHFTVKQKQLPGQDVANGVLCVN